MHGSIKNLKLLTRLAWEDPKRVTRNTRLLVGGRFSPRYKRSAVILTNSGGWGDVVMLTAVAREVRKRNPGALIHVITGRTPVFDRNPDVDSVKRLPRPDVPWRPEFKVQYQHQFPWRRHFLYSMCGCVDIRDNIALRTYVYPDVTDYAYADQIVSKLGAPPVVLSRQGKSGEGKKCWPLAHWTLLAKELLEYLPVVETGLANEALPIVHPRYQSVLGGTSFHQLAALISRAKAVITLDTAPIHIAAAFGVPTVCLLGGVFPPEAIRYPNSRILVNRPDCCDCWESGKCARDLECMSHIGVGEVLQALREACPEMLKARTTDY
jgi:ADP-heptose:LPS heptosyltransferase